MASKRPCSPITAPVRYLSKNPKYEFDMPYTLLEVEPTPEVPATNLEYDIHDVVIEDMRNKVGTLGLDENGFKLAEWPHNITMNSDFDEVQNYCKEMASLIAKELSAEEVLVFDFRFRSNDPSFKMMTSKVARNLEQCDPAQAFGGRPFHKAHLGKFKILSLGLWLANIRAEDQTEEGGLRRIRLHLTEEEFAKYVNDNHRIRIVNVWRSFNTTAQDMPLALCWPESVGVNDPIAVAIIEPEMKGENYYLRYNENQKWLWASDMMPHEALVFSTWDSLKTTQTTNCAYHTAFQNPLGPTTPRLSLEVRTIVINAM